jgi:hypothetical protein
MQGRRRVAGRRDRVDSALRAHFGMPFQDIEHTGPLGDRVPELFIGYFKYNRILGSLESA